MELVKHKNEVLKNFQSFIWLRICGTPEKEAQYKAALQTAQVVVIEEIYRQREYAPSWYVCYRNNSIADYRAAQDKDGTQTTKLLQILAGRLYYDEEETKRFIDFCAQQGVIRDTETPIKFIFMRYKPSRSAIPVV